MWKKWVYFAAKGFLLLALNPAYAQIAVLGKGWLLDSAGSITSAPSEVISGKNSIKGSFTGSDSGISQPFLWTNPTFIQFAPNQTYTITFSYRILKASSAGFQFGFFSSSAQSHGIFLPTSVVNGATGASGMATLTSNLESYSDVQVAFKLSGTGAIAVDDIRITDSAGQLFASENAEGPTVVSTGPLSFQLTDGIGMLTPASATVRSAVAKDLDGDGYPETVLTLQAPAPSETPLEPIVVEASSRMRVATSDLFPLGAPTVKSSPTTLFADINNDGLEDILFAEAGYDMTPTPKESGIGVALNMGGGKYKNISSLVPADLQMTRSYSLAVADLDGDGRVEIVLPDQDNGNNTALLRWNGNGFDAQKNWIAPSLWTSPTYLVHNDWMVTDDFDKDGRQDLLLGGVSIPGSPNLRILFGDASAYSLADVMQLPDGQFGHATTSDAPIVKTTDLGPVVVVDLNNDGYPDIFAAEEQAINYQPGAITDMNEPDYQSIFEHGGIVFADVGIQVLLNQGKRKFTDVTSGSTVQNFGRIHYFALIPVDINNDGFVDIVGLYTTKTYGAQKAGQWGTTVFLNDGTGAFQVVDGSKILVAVTTTPSSGHQWNLGAFVPTVISRQRMEGIVFDGVGGCAVEFCPAAGLNLYKVVANGAIGTGPNFVDPASLGVPGFNEFYYLRHYSDAAAAVKAGQYPNGLAHYLAVGKAKGYLSHAPNPGVPAVGPNSVVNGASFTVGTTPLSPGTIAAIFGSNLNDGSKNPTSSFGPDGRLVTTLGGASVTFNGLPAPLFASFPGQLNVQVPFELAGSTSATAVVSVNGRASHPQKVLIGPSSPGIFSINGQGTDQGAIVISSTGEYAAPAGSIPGATSRPASRNEPVTIYCTGLGDVTNPSATGAVAGHSPLSMTLENPIVTIGGLRAKVSFSGLAPGLVGVYQVNVEVPSQAPSGDRIGVMLSFGGIASNIVTIAVQ